MFNSIIDDLKSSFSYGHMVTRLMIINAIVYVVLALIWAFTKNVGWYDVVIEQLAMPTSFSGLLYKPWTLLTHLFVHEGIWHLAFNMIGLNVFGKIVGDLLGDQKILPLYIFGGFVGAILVLVLTPIMPNLIVGNMRGASAGVLAIAMAAAITAPDYNLRLLLIGNVRLKYIVLVFILFDLIASQGNSNAGGHVAHLGGMLFGAFFMFQLRNGRDLSRGMTRWMDKLSSLRKNVGKKDHRSYMEVSHRSETLIKRQEGKSKKNEEDHEFRLNEILEKIKKKGYDQLSQKEKDFLRDASNN